jgi:GGDEF domain-containing protein
MLFDEAAQHLVFVGSPWVTETAAFASLGLTLDDFAVSDAVVDYVLLLQNQSASLAEARELAERLRETASQLRHQAFYDTLTGLPNRARLLQQLQTALEQRDEDSQLAVLMMDLDGFKAVNDSFGHSAGDAVLEIVGKRLESVGRRGDVVARFGGDEFAMIVGPPRLQGKGLRPTVDVVATRVLKAISEPSR